jgi:hypothetical protein
MSEESPMTTAMLLPQWLIDEKYVTFATWGLVLATLALAVATLLLVLDSRANRKELRDRWAKEDINHKREHAELLEKWRRDDELRAQEGKPHFAWGFDHGVGSKRILIWVANLGSASFLLTALWVERQDPLDRRGVDPRPISFPLAEIVDRGTRKTFDVLREIRFPLNLVPVNSETGAAFIRYEVWCTIESPKEKMNTSRKAVHLTISLENDVISASEDMIQKLNPLLRAALV